MLRICHAAVVALIGTAVFLGLRALLVGLLDPNEYLFACTVGAFLATLRYVPVEEREYADWLIPASKIVFITFAAIATGEAIRQIPEWHRWRATENVSPLTFLWQPFAVFFWATAVTAWWLIPSAALVIQYTAKLMRRWPLASRAAPRK